MFRGGNGVAARRVHHDHAAPGRFRHVHIIDSHAGAPDDPQLRSRVQHRRRDLGLAAHHDRAEIRDDFDERRFAQAGLGRDFERAVARQFVHAALRNGIRDQDFRNGHVRASVAVLLNRGDERFKSPVSAAARRRTIDRSAESESRNRAAGPERDNAHSRQPTRWHREGKRSTLRKIVAPRRISAALTGSLARSRRKRQAIAKTATRSCHGQTDNKKAMVVADKVFQRGRNPQASGPVATGAAVGHLIIKRTLRFGQDVVIPTFEHMVSKQK